MSRRKYRCLHDRKDGIREKREDIEAVFGLKIGARGTTVRDFCADNGVEFSEFEVTLQEKVDTIE